MARELAGGRVELAHSVTLIAYDLALAVGMPTVRGSILDPAALRAALAGVDAVIHCATVVDWSDLHEDRLEEVNVRGTQVVLDACVAAGVRVFVHTSTMDVLCGDGSVFDATDDAPYPRRFLDA